MNAKPLARVLVSILAIASLSSVAIAQVTQPLEHAWTIPSNDEIRALLAQRMAHDGVGIVIGVIEPAGRRVIAYGKTGASDARALDGDSVFQIGSLTKVFTGLLLADMVQRGEVGIEDPASKFLPSGVRMPERGRPITLIDLSKHMSGLPSMPTNFPLQGRPNPYAAYTPEALYAFLSDYELPREPGRQSYSNLGVALLGRLLARHAGVEYEELLQQRVLRPLELTSTSITLTEDQLRRLVPGHDRYLRPVESWEMRAMPASGSLRSSANDLLRFLAFNLGEGTTSLYPAMVYQRTPMRALGWGRSTLGGESVYGHEGGKEGYRSAALFNPRTKTGVVVLTNARTGDRAFALARHLLFPASVLGPASVAPSWPGTAKVSQGLMEAYAGEYRTDTGRVFRVGQEDDHLMIDLNGGGIMTVFPVTDSEFISNTDDAKLAFEGGGSALVFQEGNTLQRAKRLSSPPSNTSQVPGDLRP